MGSIAQTSSASLLVMMVAMYCLIAVVATGTVPGIKWSHLEVWENSAAHDVWTRPHEYLDFRSYVLSTLGDMGYLDHLIDDFNETLRELDFVGLKTGFAVAVTTAATVLRLRRRRRPKMHLNKESSLLNQY